MTRTFRRMLISTGAAVAALALPLPVGGDAQAQDGAICMQDVKNLRQEAAPAKGGPSTINAWANAAEEACRAGDYGLASGYIADAERRLNLREAQRDESGATAARTEGASVERAEAGSAGAAGRGFGAPARAGDGDDDDSLAEKAADEIADTAEDVGEDIKEAAEDVGDKIGDAFD